MYIQEPNEDPAENQLIEPSAHVEPDYTYYEPYYEPDYTYSPTYRELSEMIRHTDRGTGEGMYVYLDFN